MYPNFNKQFVFLIEHKPDMILQVLQKHCQRDRFLSWTEMFIKYKKRYIYFLSCARLKQYNNNMYRNTLIILKIVLRTGRIVVIPRNLLFSCSLELCNFIIDTYKIQGFIFYRPQNVRSDIITSIMVHVQNFIVKLVPFRN